MTGEEFLKKILEPSTKKVGTEVPYGMMSTLKRYMNHDPYAPQGMFEGRNGNLFDFFNIIILQYHTISCFSP